MERDRIYKMQPILITGGFHIYTFADFQKFLCNSQINTCSSFAVIHRHMRSGDHVKLPDAHFPAQLEPHGALPSWFSAPALNTCSFWGQFSDMVSTFGCFFLKFLLFQRAPECAGEARCTVLQHERAVMCLGKKMHVLDKLGSGMSSSALGCESNVSISTIYIE